MPAMRRRTWLGCAAGLVLLPGVARAVRHERAALFGSPVELLLPEGAPTAAAEEVFAALAVMNRRWNAWKPGDVSELNAALRTGRRHVVTPALAAVLRDAAALEAASQGHFNPAIGGLVSAWGFHDDVMRPGVRPRDDALARWTTARPTLASLDIRGLAVRSAQRSVQIDLGAYAKGVALDMALDTLQQRGVSAALLNLGGNLAARGVIDGRPWQVGIRDPHGPGLAATMALEGNEAVVTSGTYERWRLLDGQRCTHLIDPATGQPANGLDSVTVVHRNAALADAAATALLVAGPQRWAQVAQRMGVEQALVIDCRGRCVATPRLRHRVQPTAHQGRDSGVIEVPLRTMGRR
jgi:FAD:protein FMN transferase